MKSFLLHRNLVILKPFDFPTSTPLLQTRKLAVSDNLVLSGKVFTSPAKISALNASTQESSLHVHDESPVSIELQSIGSGDDFDKVIADELVIIVWMATWCRKCIYLKPKLERLAADYYPRLPFYCVDVNMVSHKLVARAGVTKMPTIQLWKNGEKRDEVIGAYKAYLVASEVQKMIESEFSCE